MYVDWRFTVEIFLLVFAVFGVFGAEIPGCSSDPKKSCIKDYKLDILLMYDQSGSMQNTNYGDFRAASLEWVEAFFEIDGVNETQFAVMGCDRQEIFYRFTDGSFKIEIPKAIAKIQFIGGSDNFNLCSKKAVTEIFTPQGGDREEAKNVVLWISDCNFVQFDDQRESYLAQSKALQVDKNADFFFVCCKSKEGNFSLDKHMNAVMQWLKAGNKTDQSIIRYDYKNADLGKQAMDKVINVKEVELVDCVVKNSSIIQRCTYDLNFSKCMMAETYFIERHPYPTKQIGQFASKYGADCPKNVSRRQCVGCEFPATSEAPLSNEAGAAILYGLGVAMFFFISVCILFTIYKRNEPSRKFGESASGNIYLPQQSSTTSKTPSKWMGSWPLTFSALDSTPRVAKVHQPDSAKSVADDRIPSVHVLSQSSQSTKKSGKTSVPKAPTSTAPKAPTNNKKPVAPKPLSAPVKPTPPKSMKNAIPKSPIDSTIFPPQVKCSKSGPKSPKMPD